MSRQQNDKQGKDSGIEFRKSGGGGRHNRKWKEIDNAWNKSSREKFDYDGDKDKGEGAGDKPRKNE